MAVVLKRKCEECKHFKCFINKYCSEEWKPIITLNKTTFDYPSGVNIFSAGDPVTGIYEVYSGKIKIVNSYGPGKERIINFAAKEQILGYQGVGEDKTYPVTAVTLDKTQVTFIPIEIFYKALKANPGMSLYLIQFLANQLNESELRRKLYSVMPALEKVAYALITVVKSFGFDRQDVTRLAYTPSRKDIASLSGTTYETVIRGLAEFEKTSLIGLEGKSIRILDLVALKSLCEKYMIHE